MRRFALFAVAVLATVGSLTSPAYAEQRDRTNTDLHALTSIPGPTIAGVPAGGKAWTIGRGSKARVDEDGEVRAEIHGLVLADTKTALPVTQVKASVVCGGTLVGTTDLVSITPEGNDQPDYESGISRDGRPFTGSAQTRFASWVHDRRAGWILVVWPETEAQSVCDIEREG